MKIGNRIRDRRIELGMTQEELARKLGYKSKTTINKIECGVNDITQPEVVLSVHGCVENAYNRWNSNNCVSMYWLEKAYIFMLFCP